MEFISKTAAYLFASAVGFFSPVATPPAASPVLSPTSSPATSQVQKMLGKTVPDFSMKLTDGRTLTAKEMRGKVILLDFWATWCSPCREASPLMNELFVKHNKNGLVVIGADVMEEKPGPSFAKAYRAEHKFQYYFSYDNDKLFEKWNLAGVPTFVLVDHTGKVIYVADYYNDKIEKELRAKVPAAVDARNAAAKAPLTLPKYFEWIW